MVKIIGGAEISNEYRYFLWRDLGPGGPAGMVLWVMVNPSTADASTDDATIRKVVGFSRSWGFSDAHVVNLYALRSRDPKALLTHPSPIGPANDRRIAIEAEVADGIVLAWGGNAQPERAAAVKQLVLSRRQPSTPVWHLGLTKGGQPRHPLMLGYNTPRELVTQP